MVHPSALKITCFAQQSFHEGNWASLLHNACWSSVLDTCGKSRRLRVPKETARRAHAAATIHPPTASFQTSAAPGQTQLAEQSQADSVHELRRNSDQLVTGDTDDLYAAAKWYHAATAAGQNVSKQTCEQLIQGLCRGGWFREAWSVYTKLSEDQFPLRYNSYQALVTAAVQAGEPYLAVQVFRDLQRCGMRPNYVTYCGVISALSRQRRRGLPSAELAFQLWLELQQQGGHLDAAAYRTGMNACIGVGQLQQARQLLSDMAAQGLRPDVKAFNILLKGHSKVGDVQAIDSLLREMQQAGVEPSPATIGTVVNAYVQVGQLSTAKSSLADAQRKGVRVDVWSYSALIKGFVQSGDIHEARELLDDMRAEGVKPNEVTYTTLIDGYVRDCDVQAAKDLMTDMIAVGVKPNVVTYNTLLRGYAEDDAVKMEEAFEVLRAMGQAGVVPTVDTFNTLMSACGKRGDHEAVLRLFKQLVQSGYSPDAVSFTTLITALSMLGRPDDALQAFGEMRANPRVGVDLFAYNAIVGTLARAERMQEAEEQLAVAAELATQRGLPMPLEAYGAIVQGYARMGDVDAALATLRTFWERGGQPDTSMFDAVIEVCVRTGEFKQALKVVRAMERIGKPADKTRIKRILHEFHRRQERMRRNQYFVDKPVNESLERFKFWLGLPNTYYS